MGFATLGASAPATRPAAFLETFNGRDAWSRDPAGGQLQVSDGFGTFRDLRPADESSQMGVPTWTRHCRGTVEPEGILEVRLNAPPGVEYWLDLVNAENKSVATIDWSEGTGQWQARRVAFSGQYGSKGDDLFVRVRKITCATGDGVQIDRIAIVQVRNPSDSSMPDAKWRGLLKSKDNLALAEHECYVLSKTFDDVREHYTDHLIDGDPMTVWRSWPGAPFPQWVDLCWEYPLRVNRLLLVPAAEGWPQRFHIQRRDERRTWVEVKSVDAPPIWPKQGLEVTFPEVTTDRMRVVFDAADGSAVALGEIAAFGPPQPLVYQLRPYWHAHYIWYPEPDKQVKTEPRYFRKTFDIADLKSIKSAVLQTRSNDGYVVYINGVEAAHGSVDIRPVNVRGLLREGKNVIAVKASVSKDPGWAMMTFLEELAISREDGTTWIGTDPSWRCSPAAPSGWRTAAFDDHAWANAFICATPPDQPWGRIPYFDPAQGALLTVDNVKISPSPAAPGQSVQVEVTLRTPKKLNQDFLLILRAGEVEINADRSNYLVAKALSKADTSTWTADQPHTVSFSLQLPTYAPGMTVPLRLEGLGLSSRESLRFTHDGAAVSNGQIGVLPIERSQSEPVAAGPSGAETRYENGVCKIVAGGRTYSPLLWALQSPSLERFGKYSATGIHLYHLQIYPYRIDEGGGVAKTNLAFIDQHIRNLLAVDPNARILVEMDLRDSAGWAAAHPDDRLVTAQGAKQSASFASAAYAKAVRDYVGGVVRFMNKQPYAARIMGYIPEIAEPESAMGGAGQNAFQTDRSKLNIGDYNPQAIAMFRDFLREKYHNSVADLRAAWKEPKITFDTARPILADLVKEGVKGSVFRDPTQGRMPFDYFEFLSTMVPKFVLNNVAGVIKKETGGRGMVGMYYGYLVETLRSVNNPGALLQGNHFYFDQMIDSPLIDFYMSPLQYEHRMAGDRMFPFQPVDSLRLHHKLYIAEEDLRTYVSGLTSYGRQRSQEESVSVLQNHLGTAIIKGTGAWMADWSSGAGHSRTAVPFFTAPPLLKTIGEMKEIYDKTRDLQRTSATRIAVFVSPKTMYYHDVAYASVIYNNLISRMLYTQLPNIGAPFDIYMMDDVGQAFVQKQYQLYIFLNPFYMDEGQRAAVEKLKHDGKTLLFFYAPGYVSNERGLQSDDIAKVSGFHVDVSFKKQVMQCATLSGSSPILADIKPGTVYTAEGFDYAPATAKLTPTAFSPRFAIDDPHAVVLAKYSDGKGALAARDFGTWKSVYAAVPYLDTTALRNIARWAGVHLYTPPGIVVEANHQFLLLHNGFGCERQVDVSLPAPAQVHDLLTGDLVTEKASTIHLTIPRCSTRLFQLQELDPTN
jgi:hypothetical protein